VCRREAIGTPDGVTVVLPIRLYGDPILRRRAGRITDFGEPLARLASDMVETMVDADGAGLAATQVGVPLRVFVMSGTSPATRDPEHPLTPEEERAATTVHVNPEIVPEAGRQDAVEGCLSLPGLVFEGVPRHLALTLRYQDVTGARHERRFEGRTAVIVQHEVDHLDGVLFIDRLDPATRSAFMEEHRSDIAEFQRSARAYLKELDARGRAPSRQR
jgi:peptide deformylase